MEWPLLPKTAYETATSDNAQGSAIGQKPPLEIEI
jgi:hypothetical protein